MNQVVYIIGTSHGYQNLSKDLSDNSHRNFQELIKSVVSANDILIIAEENNLEALEENRISNSALQLVAEDTGLKHLFTEAERSYRKANGMEQKNDIRKSGFFNNWDEKEIEEKKQQSYRARECYWLDQILQVNVWPVLFVCGANHAFQFQNLVTNRGLIGILLHEDWNN